MTGPTRIALPQTKGTTPDPSQSGTVPFPDPGYATKPTVLALYPGKMSVVESTPTRFFSTSDTIDR
ncbi:hypothetical protein Kisp02_13940 [Kineosporia sp. NBRC 101731]|nr:hypothetical protein Kisp02_13940 [Kineosporia sp. NBRC 101731]